MPIDPALAGNAREWLRLAEEDLENAHHDLGAASPFLRDALFHCQQAAEKALKAFLTWHDLPFRRVHDLDELGVQCSQLDSSLSALTAEARPLSLYASRFRYPGAPYEPDQEEVTSALTIARLLLDAVLQRLPKELHP